MEIDILEDFKDFYNQEDAKIVKYPSEGLRLVSQPIPKYTEEVESKIEEMTKYLEATNAVGISGPQIGYNYRIILVKRSNGNVIPMINPEITAGVGNEDFVEGCLSFPGLYGLVTRYNKIIVKYQQIKDFKKKGIELEGLDAVIAQHEIDHLDGVLFIDKVNELSLRWIFPPYQVI